MFAAGRYSSGRCECSGECGARDQAGAPLHPVDAECGSTDGTRSRRLAPGINVILCTACTRGIMQLA